MTAAGVCAPWATLNDVPENVRDTVPPLDLERALLAASNELFWLSGRQFPGECEDYVRPSARHATPDHGRPIRTGGGYGSWFPGPYGGTDWVWGFCGCSVDETGCASIPSIRLDSYPLLQTDPIIEVKVDGAVLDPAAYRVDDDRSLVRTDGNGWPCCQDVRLPDTEPGTFSVRFRHGLVPVEPGPMACVELGYQFALAFNPTTMGNCALPPHVQNLVRQGATVALVDPLALIKDGFLGLFLCDRFIKATNPYGIDRPARVLSPDLPRRVRHTG